MYSFTDFSKSKPNHELCCYSFMVAYVCMFYIYTYMYIYICIYKYIYIIIYIYYAYIIYIHIIYIFIHSGVGINKKYIFHNFKFQLQERWSSWQRKLSPYKFVISYLKNIWKHNFQLNQWLHRTLFSRPSDKLSEKS